jgi:phosphate transport system protein
MHRHFEEEFEYLRSRLMRMASLVDEQVAASLQSLFSGDLTVAQAVIDRDEKVDAMDLKIDKQVERMFILTQPLAGDLRFNLAALSINKELERIGDIAVNIAEHVTPLVPHMHLLDHYPFREMADRARAMLRDTIDAFMYGDAELARRVIPGDDEVDNLERQIFQQVIRELKRNPELAEPQVHLLYILRHLERLADHATNIAEDVVFMVEAKMIKHHNRDDAQALEPRRDEAED